MKAAAETLSPPRNSAGEVDALKNAIALPKFLLILGQLILLLIAIRQFQIESSAFLRVFLLVVGGFAVHYFLPFKYRIHWFLLLSLSSIVLVLGWAGALWLMAIGAVLITLCHLPIAFRYRIVLILLFAAGLAVARTSPENLPFSPAVWPILGSIFMYRLIVYLYDLRHGRAPVKLSHRLSYFFMLPNVCFPLFPVIDSNDFRRLYYSQDRHKTYQLGVNWIARGVIHLLIYRYVYYYLTVAPAEILDISDLAQFLVANFLLYLRVSGLFHLVIGILHLFGFALPETHKLYYLSSSFTDFWRRINIYWKDFMMKVFYYPIYFRLKKYGATLGLVVSTFLVFMLTWILHSYQWFWLRGHFPVDWQDGVFWGILAVLVVINSVWEVKAGRKRQLGTVKWYSRESLWKSCRILFIFAAICSLWSLWTCESLEQWVSMWSVVPETEFSLVASAWTALGLVVALLLVSVIDSGFINARNTPLSGGKPASPFHLRSMAFSLPPIVFVALIGLPQMYTSLGADTANFILSLRSEKLSRADTEKLEKGYYEDLVRVDRFNSQLWEVYGAKPINGLDVMGSGLNIFTGDFRYEALRPSSRAATEFGVMTTNQWGMRDQDYSLEPAPGTFRIAMLGASSVMGWGVGDGETFESLLEERLADAAQDLGYARIEVLNMSVAGYYPLQQRMVVDMAMEFQPQAVFYVATGQEYQRVADYLQQALANKVDIPYAYLRELAQRAAVDAGTSRSDALRRLTPYREELLQWLYREVVDISRQHGARPVWVFLPQVNKGRWQEEVARTEDDAREAGFTTINLLDVYDDYPQEEIQLTEWDFHPNARGHRLVADRLYRELMANPAAYFSHPDVE